MLMRLTLRSIVMLARRNSTPKGPTACWFCGLKPDTIDAEVDDAHDGAIMQLQSITSI